ncbi:phospholipase effector Tle1 domain-containing protein [Vibrio algivorus]|uniref:LysM peptidoglycan-binding domain-containing protein n=1 Tax=Vibrio algivorus TaxID=1667024 RepID=A0A557P6M2_9VIBR|nr:DUF2235 domain-containing protein [Vibrio algivorus]TVO36277.1 LysM peptidoglycan-binding domain-containing protein [Vibrio algivorus]
MGSKIVPLHQLMAHEFSLVEANIKSVKVGELKALKGHASLEQIKRQLQSMDVVLLRDKPDVPALHFAQPEKTGDMDVGHNEKQWMLTPEATQYLSPTHAALLKNRAELANGPISHASQASGNLHPPLPMPTYIPEPVVNYVEPDAPLRYEYNIEIIGSSQLKGVSFSIDKTQVEEMRYADKSIKPSSKPDSLIYRIQTSVNEPKKLRCKLAQDSLSLIDNIPPLRLYPIGSGVVLDSILFFTPALQIDERLGLPTTGYYYHFYQNRLIQECRLIDGNRGFFSPTRSTHERLSPEQTVNKVTNTIGVYYQLGGQAVTDQYVIYLSEAITREQLDAVNENWLLEHGLPLDAEAMLAVHTKTQAPSTSKSSPKQSAPQIQKHVVSYDNATRSRETWPVIAAQYNLSARQLLELNPQFDANPMSLAVGDSLVVSLPQQMQVQGVSISQPNTTPQDYQSPTDCSYDYQRPNFKTVHDYHLAGSELYPLLKKYLIEDELPVVRIKAVPQRTLTIGVFFDGTGQNAKNDEYKETHGDKSRTNIARLFEAYPQKAGVSGAIYISGVGTVDKADGDTSFIDRGEDETNLAQALGVELMDALNSNKQWLAGRPLLTSVLTEAAKQKLEKTSALYKWQSLIRQLQIIIQKLIQSESYQTITHIQFDVFGFSRGAALARHFINAALKGVPDYDKPRTGNDGLGITPNLLGTETGEVFNPTQGYEVDSSKTVSVRFVGLLDTVGSFYLPGNQDNGQFQLALEPDCAQTVVQLTAHHEYRHNFPLTSLKVGNAPLPTNFHQEVFPGAHSDVGGGYPWQAQYNKKLLERYGIPAHSSYNRELVKTESLVSPYLTHYPTHTPVSSEQRDQQWQEECMAQYQQQGRVGYDGQQAYYYRLQPINSGLCGLTQERIKQQAEIAGVKWNYDLYP